MKKTVIFVFYGKSRPKYNNHTLVDREIIFMILSHNDFSFADRIEEICDRLDTLFVNKHIGGIGRTNIGISFPVEAQKNTLLLNKNTLSLISGCDLNGRVIRKSI